MERIVLVPGGTPALGSATALEARRPGHPELEKLRAALSSDGAAWRTCAPAESPHP